MLADYGDPSQRAALLRLFDRTWPGLAGKIDKARRWGWCWEEVSRPFATFRGGVALSHVGVLDLPVLLDGVVQRVAGLHAVATDPDHRRQGHFREVMREALDHVDRRWATAKLSTGQPALYEPFGFRKLPLSRFAVARTGAGGGTARPLTEQDLPWLHRQLAHRTPSSRRFASLDAGWLLGIDEVLWSGGLDHFFRVGEAVVAWEITGEALQIYEVVAQELPRLEELLAACPWPFDRVVLWLGPDRLAPDATAIPWPADDVLMVRGPWPLEGPFAVSPLASH